MQALEDLDYLAGLDDDGNLSEVGIIMSELPLEPSLAKSLIAACEYDCVDELLTIAAMLTGRKNDERCTISRQHIFEWKRTLICFKENNHLVCDICLLLAPPCFMIVEPSREEAAVTHWRPLMHTEGDHMTLINIYKAYMERMYTTALIIYIHC